MTVTSCLTHLIGIGRGNFSSNLKCRIGVGLHKGLLIDVIYRAPRRGPPAEIALF